MNAPLGRTELAPTRPHRMSPGAVPNGRAGVIADIERRLSQGREVLIFGPVGVGKTTVLRAVEERARSRSIPCGLSERTDTLPDLTGALSTAYPEIGSTGTQRGMRSRLRRAVESRPGFLLLDHLGKVGSAFKGVLRSLRGTGMGVLLAADVDHVRDRFRARRLHITHLELELAPLHGSTIRALMRSMLAGCELPFPLRDQDLRMLARQADGLPGRAARFVDALRRPEAWTSGRPRSDWLRREAIIAAAEHYRQHGP
jgi:energy-coupling factor transporter ATP-binding protein EcfA2